jgi:hypothetical protein
MAALLFKKPFLPGSRNFSVFPVVRIREAVASGEPATCRPGRATHVAPKSPGGPSVTKILYRASRTYGRGKPMGYLVEECISVMKIEGLPVIDVDDSEKITVAVRGMTCSKATPRTRTGTPSPSPYVGKMTSMTPA